MLSELWLDTCVITLIVGSIVLVLLMFLLKARGRWMKDGSEKAKRVAIALLVTIILIIASTVVLSIYIDQNRVRYDYTATVASDQSGVVYVPAPVILELQDQLRVRSGDGSISFVDTEHGRALRIEFSGNVTVHGRIVRSDHVDDWGLTMLNDTRGREAWVNLRVDGDQESDVALNILLDNENVPGHDAAIFLRHDLGVGWNVYWTRGSQE